MTRTLRTRLTALLAVAVAATTTTGALAPIDARASDGWTDTRTEAHERGLRRSLGDEPIPGIRDDSGDQAPLRSGTIVDGVFTTSYAWDCQSQPDCGAWLRAGCDDGLAGRDPAWHASIEKVAELADGTTIRALDIRRGSPESVIIGGVVVQFFQSDCTEIHAARWRSTDCAPPSCRHADRWHSVTGRSGREWVRHTLRIPSHAAWMTVSANDNLNITWALT